MEIRNTTIFYKIIQLVICDLKPNISRILTRLVEKSYLAYVEEFQKAWKIKNIANNLKETISKFIYLIANVVSINEFNVAH